MQRIYYAIVLLVLYGDLLKRVLPPSAALFAVYASALVILFAIATRSYSFSHRLSEEGHVLRMAVISLTFLYAAQLLTSYSEDLLDATSHALYMIVPILYIWVLQSRCPDFDLVRLGKLFLLFMIPINLVGVVQYYFDSTFLISTSYDEVAGGIIERNFLYTGSFNRYPSLFASADRYSAMALMHLYFTAVVFRGARANSNQAKLWLIINIVSAVVALLVAGARSRILIAIVVAILSMITYLIKMLFAGKLTLMRAVGFVGLTLFISIIMVQLTAPHELSEATSEDDLFPVIAMLAQTLQERDIAVRVDEAAEFSLLPHDITFFGQGLGTIGKGKPGEFGIQSIWAESGLFWGVPMLIAFLVIVVSLALMAWRSFLTLEPLNVAIYSVPLLMVIFALLAGLTSSFELSSGLVLGCLIAVISRRQQVSTTSSQRPELLHRVIR